MKLGEIPLDVAKKYMAAKMTDATMSVPEFIRMFFEFIAPYEQNGTFDGNEVTIHISGMTFGNTNKHIAPNDPSVTARRERISAALSSTWELATSVRRAAAVDHKAFANDIEQMVKEGKVEKRRSETGYNNELRLKQ